MECEFNYSSPWDPSSPWSLTLAFTPTRVDPSKYVSALNNTSLAGAGPSMDQGTCEYVQSVSEALGWKPVEPATAETVAEAFMQVRLRQMDEECTFIRWDPKSKFISNSKWYQGILRPLTLMRSKYNSLLQLKDFEQMPDEDAFAELSAPVDPRNVLHIVNYILQPWCSYKGTTKLLENWAKRLPLSTAVKLANKQELQQSIVDACYDAPFDASLLHDISERDPNPQLKTDIAAALVLQPYRLETIKHLRESPEAAVETVSRFVYTYPSHMGGIWEALDKICQACPEMPVDATIKPLVLQEYLNRGQFVNLSQNASKYSPQMVAGAVDTYITHSEQELGSDPEMLAKLLEVSRVFKTKHLAKFRALSTLVEKYRLSPRLIKVWQPRHLLQELLKSSPRAYQSEKLADMISTATSKELDPQYVYCERVKAALADDQFYSASEICHQMDHKSPYTWQAFFATASHPFSSPEILNHQHKLMRLCIELCPSSKLSLVAAQLQVLEKLKAGSSLSPTASANMSSISTSHGAAASTQKKNLFVSSLGWAIGAPQD